MHSTQYRAPTFGIIVQFAAIMSTFSKLLLDYPKHLTCHDLIHPHETCTHQFIDMAWRGLTPFAQYYLPTLVVPLALKLKSLNRDILQKALIDYGKAILIGNWLATGTFSSICLFYKIFGKMYYPLLVQFSVAFGSIMFIFYPDRIKQWQSTGLVNLCIETLIRKSNNGVIEYLRKSRTFGTLLFMSFSAVILTGFKITGVKRFWFTSLPAAVQDKSDPPKNCKPCVHDKPCASYIWTEFTKSSKLAVILGLLKFVVSSYKRIKCTQPIAVIKLFLKNLDYGLIAFTVSYNTLFKLLSCWFNNSTGENTVSNTMVAGFISGISYNFYPIYMLFTYGLTASLQMGWFIYSKYIANRMQNSEDSGRNTNHFIRLTNQLKSFVNKLPMSSIIMYGCLTQLFQNLLEHPYATPRYVSQFMTLGTSKRVDHIALRFSGILLGFTDI